MVLAQPRRVRASAYLPRAGAVWAGEASTDKAVSHTLQPERLPSCAYGRGSPGAGSTRNRLDPDLVCPGVLGRCTAARTSRLVLEAESARLIAGAGTFHGQSPCTALVGTTSGATWNRPNQTKLRVQPVGAVSSRPPRVAGRCPLAATAADCVPRAAARVGRL